MWTPLGDLGIGCGICSPANCKWSKSNSPSGVEGPSARLVMAPPPEAWINTCLAAQRKTRRPLWYPELGIKISPHEPITIRRHFEVPPDLISPRFAAESMGTGGGGRLQAGFSQRPEEVC